MPESPRWTHLGGRVYHAIPGLETLLSRELAAAGGETAIRARWGPLIHAAGEGGESDDREKNAAGVFWYRNAWLEPFSLTFGSIGEAAAALRAVQRNWADCLTTQFRRGALLRERLPPLPSRPRPFPWPLPAAPMGAYTLLDAHTLVGSPRCSSPFPNGAIAFQEDHDAPPSRAYLKIWEALTLFGDHPRPGDRCLDAGASPGGWTWALNQLGATVLAVDRAPLDPRVAALPGVEWLRHDAFTLRPRDVGSVTWVFCDAACYPARLYDWVERWLAEGSCRRFVCTLKAQGQGDPETIRRFAALGRVTHLWHNKHELTWFAGDRPLR